MSLVVLWRAGGRKGGCGTVRGKWGLTPLIRMINNKSKLPSILLLCLCIYGCGKKEAQLYQDSRINIDCPTGQTFTYQVYRIPKGSFRGVKWEFRDDRAFELWYIDKKGTDFEIYIPVSDKFLEYDEHEITEEWEFDIKEDTQYGLINYEMSHPQKKITLKFRLPYKEGKYYNFAVLTNNNNKYLIMFMDLSNRIIDKDAKGIFGYVIVNRGE